MQTSRILAVDDDINVLHLVQLFLEKTKQFEVRLEERSRHALSAAREFQPALILLDINMPGLDGGDVAHQFRGDPLLKDVPIIFLSSLLAPGEAQNDLVWRGGELFLAKPVDPALLVRAVKTVLQRNAAPAA